MPNESERAGSANSGAQASLAERMRARDAYITGQPPRIPPMEQSEITDEMRALTAVMRRGAAPPPDSIMPNYPATVLRYPELYRRHSDLAVLLMDGALSARDRELAVLRTGWLCQAPFEWSAHVDIGKRVAKISAEEIEWVIIGSTAPGWNEHDSAILRAVEELIGDAMITDATWAVLEKTLDAPQLMELPILIGQYLGVAFLQNSIRLRLMSNFVGLSAR